jgi:hypothetical protein
MKLYVWHYLDSVAQYGPGMAYAHADTIEEAREYILKYTEIDKRDLNCLEKELHEREPDIYEGPMGAWEWGSA